jgi:Ca2+-binding EF-hand superfamily protein
MILKGLKVSSTELDDMFKEADVTGSNKIGFPEFMSMMARKMKQVYCCDS